MISALLRAAHAPAWIVFPVIYGLYILTASWWLINGYTRELFGSPLPHMGRIHKVVYNFHTGLPVHGKRTHGDQKRLDRVIGGGSRQTLDGALVYYSKWKRWHRALRNNLLIFGWLLASCGMALNPLLTVRFITVLVLLAVIGLCWLLIRRKRAEYRRRRPVSRPAYAQTKRARSVLEADTTTLGRTSRLEIESAPVLEGVPPSVLAALLAPKMGCSTAELLNRMQISPDGGSIALPDSYTAIERERENVEEIIAAHFKGKTGYDWLTTQAPRMLMWHPVIVHRLPTLVRFRDYLDEINALPARQTGLGVIENRSMFVQSHLGDLPMWCRFMGSGTGKSTGFLVKAAQIAHKDPAADIYCIDTKQISFEPLHGIPGIYIYDNPVTGMRDIWEVFYELNGILESRYTAVREKRAKLSDFNDIWVFGDEGNHLGDKLKLYHSKVLGESGASPAVWREAIAPLFQQGRQANIFCEWMFQDLTDRAMGGMSLKFAFSAYIAAGFMPNQFTRTIGNPAPECQEGPGRQLVCIGKNRTWVQGFYDDEQYLHDYALENRMERAA